MDKCPNWMSFDGLIPPIPEADPPMKRALPKIKLQNSSQKTQSAFSYSPKQNIIIFVPFPRLQKLLLSKTKIRFMKKYFIALSILSTFFCFSFSYSQNPNFCDGPYLSYTANGQVIVRAINATNAATIDSFPEKEKSSNWVNVRFSNHPDWDFTVPLRPQITNEPATYNPPEKILVLSDIEGDFENFRGLLIANHVIDNLYRWTFSKGHLVICGDLFDRGNDVAAELWLLYRLEDEAKKAGGYVHTILGNHDVMNLSGDWRYVQQKYFDHAKSMGLDYSAFYNENSELGRWLRSKNIIEKIGDNFCLHRRHLPPENPPASPGR